jgi:uncharacterized protein YcbX
MMPTVKALWRHPIKGHSREALDHVELIEGQTMPWDRRWAVAHELSDADGSEWAPCQKFTRGSRVAEIMGINSRVDESTGMVTLDHPDLPDLTFNPDLEADAFLSWVREIMPVKQPQSVRIVRVEGRGMTDTDYPSVSLINLASHAAVASKLAPDLSELRWRCNIHFDGLDAWREFDWVGQTVRVGSAEIKIEEPIERCTVPSANPANGKRDADVLGTLMRSWGHINFGIAGVVTKSGNVTVGDTVEPI